MTAPSRYPDGMWMYCPVCMVELPSHHKHTGETLEVFCPKNHFVTRFIKDPSSKTGWELDPSVYRK